MDIFKPSVWIPIALVVIGMVCGAVAGAFAVFLTKEVYASHQAAEEKLWIAEKAQLLLKIADNAQEIAGISINQQAYGAKQQIRWLQQEMRDFRKKHGNPPYSDPDTQAEWDELKQALDDERDRLKDLQRKLK